MIYLQSFTAQGLVECQMFARFALRKIPHEAEAAGVDAEILEETPSKHGILSAVLKLSGSRAESLAAAGRARCNGPAQPAAAPAPMQNWYIGVFSLSEIPALPAETKVSNSKPATPAAKAGST